MLINFMASAQPFGCPPRAACPTPAATAPPQNSRAASAWKAFKPYGQAALMGVVGTVPILGAAPNLGVAMYSTNGLNILGVLGLLANFAAMTSGFGGPTTSLPLLAVSGLLAGIGTYHLSKEAETRKQGG